MAMGRLYEARNPRTQKTRETLDSLVKAIDSVAVSVIGDGDALNLAPRFGSGPMNCRVSVDE
jgi:hypothetical protein